MPKVEALGSSHLEIRPILPAPAGHVAWCQSQAIDVSLSGSGSKYLSPKKGPLQEVYSPWSLLYTDL